MKEMGIKYIKILVNTIVAISILAVCLFLVPKLIGFFLPVLIGLGIGMLANPVVALLENKLKIHRKMGSVMMIIGVLTFLGIGLYWVVSLLVRQLIYLLRDIPHIVETVEGVSLPKNLSKIYQSLPLELQNSLNNFVDNSIQEVTMASGEITPFVADTAKSAVNNIPIVLLYFIFSLLCAYFFVVDKDKIIEKYRTYCPQTLQRGIGFVYDMLAEILGGYFKAQAKLMGLVAGVIVISFFILKVRYALVLALIIALLDALPFLGTGTVLVPWAIFAAINGNYGLGIGLVVTYVLTQVLRRILEPKFVADGIGVHPFLAVIYMFVGFKLKGVLGMIVAVPLGMIVMTLIQNGLFQRPMKIVKSVVGDIRHFCQIPGIDDEK